MARLMSHNARRGRRILSMAAVLAAAFALAGCNQTLGVKDEVAQKAIEAAAAAKGKVSLSQGATAIASGGSIDLGHTVVGASSDTVFTITNSGGSALTLDGNPAITGANASEFSVQALSFTSIGPGSSATFALRFSPTSAAAKTATVTIASNAASSFAFTVTATGDAKATPHLTLWDGSTQIAVGGTATWPDTMLTFPSVKTFTIKNDGSANLVLAGPNYVAITGGAGQTAYGSLTQPTTATLSPGSSTPFNVTFTPPAADADYPVTFVINSNDPANPAFSFFGSGHSIQWHGSKALVSSTSFLYSNPKIAIVGSTIYVAYISSDPSKKGIVITYSTNGGNNWSEPMLAAPAGAGSIGGFSFAASANSLNLLYNDPDYSNQQVYRTSPTSPANLSFSPLTLSGTYNALTISNNAIAFAGGKVYVAVLDDNTTRKLFLAVRTDTPTTNGNSFSSYTITDAAAHTGGFYAAIQADSTNVYLSYLDGNYVRCSTVPVASIADSTTYKYGEIFIDPSYAIGTNALAIDSSRLYSLWGPSDGLSISSKVTNGFAVPLSWSSSPSTIVSEGAGGGKTLGLYVGNGKKYALYGAIGGPYGAMLRLSSSQDSGTTWSSALLDDSRGLASVQSAMAISGSTIYVVYATGSGNPNDNSITLKKSLDGGATW